VSFGLCVCTRRWVFADFQLPIADLKTITQQQIGTWQLAIGND
jgi:hypothetical protein